MKNFCGDNRRGIGIIGCGNIVFTHIEAYKSAKYRIVALADINEENLKEKAALVPGVKTFADYRELLSLPEVEIVDCATHPESRVGIIKDALNAGKHVLSQKPFVTDLKSGERLAKLAEKKKVFLAVNQNGRWNPSWNYAYQIIRKGGIGKVMSVHMRCHWDHNRAAKKREFNKIRHLILYDYGIHWFDIISCWIDKEPKRVFAFSSCVPNQKTASPLSAQVIIKYENAQASVIFDGSQTVGGEDYFFIGGTKGAIVSRGTDFSHRHLIYTRPVLEIRTQGGTYRPNLKGSWFPNGFHGTMGELLCAIEEERKPWNNANDNLRSLRLCFSACASADREEPVDPETITKLGEIEL